MSAMTPAPSSDRRVEEALEHGPEQVADRGVAHAHRDPGDPGDPGKDSFGSAVAGELRQVVWPSRPQLVRNIVTTLVFAIGATGLLTGSDYLLSQLAAAVFAR